MNSGFANEHITCRSAAGGGSVPPPVARIPFGPPMVIGSFLGSRPIRPAISPGETQTFLPKQDGRGEAIWSIDLKPCLVEIAVFFYGDNAKMSGCC